MNNPADFPDELGERGHIEPRTRTRPARPPIPMDRLVGWVLFFGVVAMCVGAFLVTPGTGSIPDVAARDIGEGRASQGAGGSGQSDDPQETSPQPSSQDDTAADQTTGDAGASTDAANPTTPTSLTIAFTGDVLVHESVAESARTASGYDFAPQFAEVAQVLGTADLALCHLETPISTDNSTLSYYPTFLVPSQVADGIDSAGFHGCSVSSNHSLDAGEAGLGTTAAELDRVALGYSGIAGPGESRGRFTIYSVAGITVSHLSYTYGFNGLEASGRNAELANVLDVDTIASDAAKARARGANFVVVSAHWGDEFSIGLSDYQDDLGPKIAALADVDLVIGHHAHVVQQLSRVDDTYIAYGLGNFLSNQGPDPDSCPSCPPESQDGVILLVDIETAAGIPEVTGVRAVATWVDRANGHVIRVLDQSDDGDRAQSYDRTLSALTGDGVEVEMVTR